jgi:diketogulonate reductase-like aldo/keto reductase
MPSTPLEHALPTHPLRGGRLTLPAVGFGTYPLRGQEGVRAVATAIEAGYRLIDSAVNYDNEGAVGAAVRASGLPREELLVTSKLPGRFHARADAIRCVEESVLRTGLDVIDLYLIHWPNPLEGRYVEAWEALLTCRERGLVREVGVSNFLPEHLDALVAATGEAPAVNQVELHPFFPQEAQLAYHAEHGILTEAWSPLARAQDLDDQPAITAAAAAHGVTPAQVVVRWHVQRGVLPLPKSGDPARQAANLDVAGFELSGDEVAAITALGRPDGRLFDADPASHQEF